MRSVLFILIGVVSYAFSLTIEVTYSIDEGKTF